MIAIKAIEWRMPSNAQYVRHIEHNQRIEHWFEAFYTFLEPMASDD